MNEHESPAPQSQAQTQDELPRLTEAEIRYWAALGLITIGEREKSPKTVQTGVGLLEETARLGYARAKRTLGEAHVNGFLGLPADLEKGIALLREAVADGDGDAELELARAIYWKNPPSDADVLWDAATVLWRDRADYTTAFLLMSRAARMNHVPAMRDYAQMLREGIGCDADPKLAHDIEWQADELSKGREEPMK